MFKKDNFIYGCVLGLLAPVVGLLILRYSKFGTTYTLKEVLRYVFVDDSTHSMLTAGLTVSLLLNAFFFTMYVNGRRDKTAKGIFITTLVYGITILLLKFLR